MIKGINTTAVRDYPYALLLMEEFEVEMPMQLDNDRGAKTSLFRLLKPGVYGYTVKRECERMSEWINNQASEPISVAIELQPL